MPRMKPHWKNNGLICLLLIIILFCGCRGIRAVAYETKYLVQRATNDTLYHYLAQDEIEITSEPVKYGWRGTPCYIKDSVKYYYYEKGRIKVTASHSIASKNVIRYIECMQGLRQKVLYEFYPNGDTASITTVEKGGTKSMVQFMNNQRVSSTEF